jgi:hypothetical protein
MCSFVLGWFHVFAAGERPGSGQPDFEGERLRQVVVGAGVQPRHDVVGGIARGEQKDRGSVVCCAGPPYDREAIQGADITSSRSTSKLAAPGALKTSAEREQT